MISIKTENNIIYTVVEEKFVNEDFDKLKIALEKLIRENPKVKWYYEMQHFEGYKLNALLQDVKFDFKHTKDFYKIAMVCDKTWEKWMAAIMKPFTPATIKYFSLEDKTEALNWIRE